MFIGYFEMLRTLLYLFVQMSLMNFLKNNNSLN